jgi:protein phosphatase
VSRRHAPEAPSPADVRPPSVPDFSLVLLVGASGAGKSTYAKAHFAPGEVVSSDACRAQVGDGEDDGAATPLAFELLEKVVELRLRARRLCVVDATNLRPEDRARLRALAVRHHALAVAIVLDPGETACRARVAARGRPHAGPDPVRGQYAQLRRTLPDLRKEGFKSVHVLDAAAAVAAPLRTRLWTDRTDESGPFDVVGDVHGCLAELECLLGRLGWEVFPSGTRPRARHPEGRKVAFVGDLVDRGPDVAGVLDLAMDMVEDGTALCVAGNHEAKLERWIRGRGVRMTHGLDLSAASIDARGRDFKERVGRFLSRLVSHYMLDGGRLAVAHAGIPESMQGRASGAVREFCMYGPVTGETAEDGLPVRGAWVPDYRGSCRVVYGHTPVTRAEWVNNTLCLDTGCVFGGSLSALRYPEMEVVSVPAARTYAEPHRPFLDPGGRTAQQADDRDLDVADFLGKRALETRLMPRLTVREAQAAAALDAVSRHAVDPRWLVYLPPTMAPCATSSEPGYLEHPREAFALYRKEGVARVVAEEKHMGSRATVALCRTPEAAAARFGVEDGSRGEVWTRTGRPFFADAARRDAFLADAASAAEDGGLFRELGSDWAVLDAEIMPWSEKALGLVKGQYAPVASAGRVGLSLAMEAMRGAVARGLDLGGPLRDAEARLSAIEGFAAEVRRYAPPPAEGALRVGVFHVLASEGAVHHGRTHLWHLAMGARLAVGGGPFVPTRHVEVDLADPASEEAATRAWLAMTADGAEGFVVKPLDFLAPARRGFVQPAVKCRGKGYLSIVYGPGYDAPDSLARLRHRSLSAKQSLARREFAAGIEGLERFVRREPLRRVHECALAVLAFESEAVDPRL